MRIKVDNIPADGLHIEAEEPAFIAGVKEKDVIFKSPVKVSVDANIASHTLLVKGTLETKANLVCGRCLKEYQYPIFNKDFDVQLDIKGLNEVDLTDDIRENILILLPVKPLCKIGCLGLCPKCGQDLNEKKCKCKKDDDGDFKWKELDKLKF